MIQAFTNALYKGMLWVQNHSLEEIAEVVKPYFPDIDDEVLIMLLERYKNQDSWKPDPVVSKEGFEHLMDIMELAGELDKRANYDDIVNTEFAEKAMENVKLE